MTPWGTTAGLRRGGRVPVQARQGSVLAVVPSPRALAAVLQRAAIVARDARLRHVDVLSARLAARAGFGASGGHAVIGAVAAPAWRWERAAPSLVITHYEAHCASIDAFDHSTGTWAARAAPNAPVVLGWHEQRLRAEAANLARLCTLACQCAGPVLLVRDSPLRPSRHALFATDFSDASLASLGVALAALPAARFTLLYEARVPGEAHMRTAGVSHRSIDACRHALEARARAGLARFAARLGPQSARLSLVTLREPQGRAIVRHAAAVRPDVIVLSDGPRGIIDGWLWQGSVCAILRRTACDVLMLAS